MWLLCEDHGGAEDANRHPRDDLSTLGLHFQTRTIPATAFLHSIRHNKPMFIERKGFTFSSICMSTVYGVERFNWRSEYRLRRFNTFVFGVDLIIAAALPPSDHLAEKITSARGLRVLILFYLY